MCTHYALSCSLRLTGGRWALCLLFLLPLGCDASGPSDEADAPIARLDLRLLRADLDDATELIIVQVRGEQSLEPGASSVADTLRLVPGATYEGNVRLFDAQDRNALGQVTQDPENHQFFYTMEGIGGVGLVVTDVESDYGHDGFGEDLRVGLAFRVTVSEQERMEEGVLRVQLGRFAEGRKNGMTLTVPPIVDIRIPLQVTEPPPPPLPPSGPAGNPEFITRAVLTLARTDGTETLTVTADDVRGLNLGERILPDFFSIESCVPEEGGMRCTDMAALVLKPGDYEGRWEVFDDAAGIEVTDELIAEADWHQFFYRLNFGPDPFTSQDSDNNGFPLGQTFVLSVPTGVSVSGGDLRVILGHFNPACCEVKDGRQMSSLTDMEFRIPMEVAAAGLPETITRTVLTLQREDALETITMTVAGDSLSILDATPEQIGVETCTGPVGEQVCTMGQPLTLTADAGYTGTLEVFNDLTGENVMDEIVEEGTLHQFFYLGDLEDAITITDVDAAGLPLGFTIQVMVPASPVEGALRILLGHYGRGGPKTGTRFSLEQDLHFSVPLSVQ